MRLLHTSDWHLGRSFHGVGMLEAQRRFVDQLIAAVHEHYVDVVLIAGDVYDRALPGLDVVRLLDDALVRLSDAGATMVLTSGNHDSAIRLGFASRLLERGGVHLRTRVDDIAVPVMLPLGSRAVGDSKRPSVAEPSEGWLAIYGIPYLEPRLVAEQLGAESASHFGVTRAAVDLIEEDLAGRRRDSAVPVHSVVLAHTFASGGVTSDSERELSIGGLDVVPLDLFNAFDYTALGHLHGKQELSGRVRYSGSPLAYSFSEAAHRKGAWVIDVDGGGVTSVQEILWEAPRKLATLRGTLDGLLADPALDWAEAAYCQVTLTDASRPAQAMERLRTRFPETLVLAFEPEGAAREALSSYSGRLAEAQDDLAVCCGFLEHVRGREANAAEGEILRAALEAVWLEEAEL
ncbi:exonuclease SbcCD subunit D [Arthrobacter sp. M4]|uniref:exonuclease SbcCD subunit D n=1 Tax=Arthrobacter sp. M4 TaxID=218160 RepID=UPI001CDD5833|nr:exonuclease SbcCD subunit D [Arthrobacter sp. M4]MCA4132138.1 exonuclease SbcCD subunit D [Arthrobacter sp. M4]